jgi:tetratricopeptide (TPR) repeat protein
LASEVRAELRSLGPVTAERVARHLVATGQLLDEDPDAALEQARAARSYGARIAAVREAAGVAAYRAGEWAEAIAELRTARRMTGDSSHLPLIADSERALGRPERALALVRSPEAAALAPRLRAEMRIVESGARRDLGQLDAALVALQGPDLDRRTTHEWSARLWYAYADLLVERGDLDGARNWFLAAASVDADGETDAADRLLELDGVTVYEDADDTFDDEDPFTDHVSVVDRDHRRDRDSSRDKKMTADLVVDEHLADEQNTPTASNSLGNEDTIDAGGKSRGDDPRDRDATGDENVIADRITIADGKSIGDEDSIGDGDVTVDDEDHDGDVTVDDEDSPTDGDDLRGRDSIGERDAVVDGDEDSLDDEKSGNREDEHVDEQSDPGDEYDSRGDEVAVAVAETSDDSESELTTGEGQDPASDGSNSADHSAGEPPAEADSPNDDGSNDDGPEPASATGGTPSASGQQSAAASGAGRSTNAAIAAVTFSDAGPNG